MYFLFNRLFTDEESDCSLESEESEKCEKCHYLHGTGLVLRLPCEIRTNNMEQLNSIFLLLYLAS